MRWLAWTIIVVVGLFGARHLGADDAALEERIQQELATSQWTKALADSDLLRDLRSLAKDDLGVAIADVYRGVALAGLGRYGEAKVAFRRALPVLDARGAPPQVVQVLVLLGSVHAKTSDFSEALRDVEAASRRLGETGDPELKAEVLIARADVWTELHDYAEAEGLYKRALDLATGAASDARPHALAAYGWLLHLSERSKLGVEFLERAREIHAARKDFLSQSNVDRALGQVLFDMGDREEAAKRYATALPAQTSSEAAHTWVCLAQAQRVMGKHQEAAASLARARELLDASDARDIVLLWEREMAEQAVVRGDAKEAIAALRHAFVMLRQVTSGLSDVGMTGAESHRDRSPLYDLALRVGVRTWDPEILFEFIEQTRAYALLYALGGRAALDAQPVAPHLREREEATARALAEARVVHRAAEAAGDRVETRAASDRVKQAESEFAAAHEAIQRGTRHSAFLSEAKPASLSDVREKLGRDHAALVEYVLLPEGAHALVVTADGARIPALGETKKIIDAADALDSAYQSKVPNEEAVRNAEDGLRDLVLDRLQLPEDIQRLFISPDGVLAHVAFPALLRETETSVTFVPSGTVYLMLRGEAELQGKGLLAVGDPLYGEVQSDAVLAMTRGRTLRRLEKAAEEVRAILREGDVGLLREKATESGFLAAARTRERWGAFHFVCHGLVDATNPGMSALALTPEKDRDGMLTAIEVFDSGLSADLAVLSACQTGRGEIVRVEGSMGLARAFLAARIPRVVVSLWDVDDEATSALMAKFHEHWRDGGLHVSQALRLAQEDVRKDPKYAHPRFWAAWVVWGLAD